jgi:type I restriction enzyme S subunit
MKLAACQRFEPASCPAGWTVEAIKNRLCLEYGTGLIDGDRQAGDYPVYGSNGLIGTHDTYLVDGPGILVGRKGSVGEVHFTEKAFWPIDTVYYVRRLGQDNWLYLYHLLGYLKLGQLNAATGVPGLNRRDAHFMLGAFPPPDEEDEIAAILKLADDALAAMERKLTAARRLKTALMQQLFTQGIPGRHTQFQETKIGKIPAEWDVVMLRRLAFVDSGLTLNPDRAPRKNARQYLTVVNVQRERLDMTEVRFLEMWDSEIPAMQLKEGDILAVEGHANSSEIGRAAIVTQEVEGMTFQNHLFRVRLLEGVTFNRRFLLGWLNSECVRRHWNATANTSSGLNTINRRGLRRLLIPKPKDGEQDEIAGLLEAADANIAACEQELVALRRLKTALLQNLLTGKVRVSAVAGAVADKKSTGITVELRLDRRREDAAGANA